jgi:hypothetical protein
VHEAAYIAPWRVLRKISRRARKLTVRLRRADSKAAQVMGFEVRRAMHRRVVGRT